MIYLELCCIAFIPLIELVLICELVVNPSLSSITVFFVFLFAACLYYGFYCSGGFCCWLDW